LRTLTPPSEDLSDQVAVEGGAVVPDDRYVCQDDIQRNGWLTVVVVVVAVAIEVRTDAKRATAVR